MPTYWVAKGFLQKNQNERDALASFIFNLGAGAFESSTLLKKINEGDKQGAANEFLKWDKFRNPVTKKLETLTGLTKRRVAEKSLFESKALWNGLTNYLLKSDIFYQAS